MAVLDYLLQVWGGVNLLATATSTNSIDQQVVTRHMENGEEIGFGIFVTALTPGSTDTYEFQVITDSAASLVSAPVVIADTGTMTNTDSRIVLSGNLNGLFLSINPNTLLKEWVGLKFIGANTPNITVSAYLMNEAQWTAYVAQPANYTP